MKLTVVQTLPALNAGGVERGTIDVAAALVNQGHRSIVISDGGEMLKELLAKGSEHIQLPLGEKSLSTLLLVSKLRKVLKENNVDILHARSRLPAWISYLAWKKMDSNTRPRFVTSVHGPYSVNRYSKIMTRGERVIAISAFIQNYIRENYSDVDMNKVVVIPRGVDPTVFSFDFKPSRQWLKEWKQQHPQLQGRYILTLPARITRWKGQLDFIEIIAQLLSKKINVHGLIAGGAEPRRLPYLDELKSRAQSLSVDQHISFIGHRNDLREVMSVSDLVMSLAREPEAFGRTAMEALSLGVPVVAYDHGGASEVLTAMFAEGLVPALDKEMAVKRITEFYLEPRRVEENSSFKLSRMLESTINLYSELGSID